MLQEDKSRKGYFERAQFGVGPPPPARGRSSRSRRSRISTGWRTKSEILPLQWQHVDLHAGVVRLDPGTTKNREGRVLVFKGLDELRTTLEGQWVEHQKLEARAALSPWVFHRKGKRIRSYRGAWLAACKAAGCPGRIPHDFRRTAVRNLVRAGVPDVVAMRMTGHKDALMFDRYNIVSESDLSDAGQKLNALAGTIAGTIAQISGGRPAVRPSESQNFLVFWCRRRESNPHSL